MINDLRSAQNEWEKVFNGYVGLALHERSEPSTNSELSQSDRLNVLIRSDICFPYFLVNGA